ncbi:MULTISPECIES: hypothetical protein [unclassified Francisella]|uniref:hypothetical protein n=1 Tax=unclassified Francisella TaxID=2610885 RepID=UPI002E317278|nr:MULTISPECIES: hypothetical protein [unclassified Francisella]MED7820118.1 hypothetical protein [Francisella sp. 19S2-4]MED7830951.1 hypothetical protein [Francisella sp. 19S2-10]
MRFYKFLYMVIMLFIFSIVFANAENNLVSNQTAKQMQHYIDTSKDCMIVQNKKQIVLKCGDNMIFVTSEGVGIKTPHVSKFWN